MTSFHDWNLGFENSSHLNILQFTSPQITTVIHGSRLVAGMVISHLKYVTRLDILKHLSLKLLCIWNDAYSVRWQWLLLDARL